MPRKKNPIGWNNEKKKKKEGESEYGQKASALCAYNTFS